MQPALRIVVLPGEAQVDLGAALAQRFAAAEGVGLPLPGDLAAGVGGQARGVEVVAMEVEQGRVADLALGVVVGVDGGQRQAVQPQVVLGSQFPAAAVVFGFAEQLAVGTVEVGGDALGGELDDALAEGVVAVFGDLLAVEADALQAALGVVGQFARGAVLGEVAGGVAGHRLRADGGQSVAVGRVLVVLAAGGAA